MSGRVTREQTIAAKTMKKLKKIVSSWAFVRTIRQALRAKETEGQVAGSVTQNGEKTQSSLTS